MAGDFHIDMSGKLHKAETVGIACFDNDTKIHNGCALKKGLIRDLRRHLFDKSLVNDNARLYAICVFILIKDRISDGARITICNDENFFYVKVYLSTLLESIPNIKNIKLINISELRKSSDVLVKDSLADSYANAYRKRALNKVKWGTGIGLDAIRIDYNTIKHYWHSLNNKT